MEARKDQFDAVQNETNHAGGSAFPRSTTFQSGPLKVQLWRTADGRIHRKQETLGGKTTDWEYTYDIEGRLWGSIRNGRLAEAYQYDQEGRRTLETSGLRHVFEREYHYAPDGRLHRAGGDNFAYDVSGALTARIAADGATTRYLHGHDGRIDKIVLPNGENVEYAYGPGGVRTAVTIDGASICEYEWEHPLRLTLYFNGRFHRFLYSDGLMPDRMLINGKDSYSLAFDQVGTLRAVADEQGKLIKVVEFNSWGNLLFDSNPNFDVPFGFAGGIRDPLTGLTHFHFREYDPDTARWTSKDPLGLAGGDTDLYGYCLDEPISGIDPLGLFRFGKRPLDNTFGKALASLTRGSKGANENNVELVHEQGFYEDGSGKNIGLGPDGIVKNESPDQYTLGDYYDDKTMNKAEIVTPKGEYKLFGNNCQDYSDRLRANYKKRWHQELLKRGEEDYGR